MADWLERVADERITEYEELLAHHLARSTEYRREIGLVDADTDSLARRAAKAYRRAADRARARSDVVSGARLLGQAAVLLEPGDGDQSVVLADQASLLADYGDLPSALNVANASVDSALASDDEPTRLLADVIHHYVTVRHEGATLHPDVAASALSRARDAAETVGSSRSDIGARLWLLVSEIEGSWFLRCQRARLAAERARELAARSELAWLENESVVSYVVSAMRGPGRISKLIKIGQDATRGRGGEVKKDFLIAEASLWGQHGNPVRTRECLNRAEAIVQELGAPEATMAALRGMTFQSTSEPSQAIDPLRAALTAFLDLGHISLASSLAAVLARVLALTDDYAGAVVESERARTLASESDVGTQLFWRCAAARVDAAAGRTIDATERAKELVELVESIEWPEIEFYGRIDAAEAYHAAGENARAERLLRRAADDSRAREAHAFEQQAVAALDRLYTASTSPQKTGHGSNSIDPREQEIDAR